METEEEGENLSLNSNVNPLPLRRGSCPVKGGALRVGQWSRADQTGLAVDRAARRAYFERMTAVEIIAEIEHLPANEQAKVVAFAQHLGERAMLSGTELTKLASRLADGPHPAEAARLREEIEKGFYGASSHA